MIPNFSTMVVLLPLVLSTILSASAAANLRARAAHNTVAKRIRGDLSLIESLFTGARWTFYDAGLGACGETNTENDFIVALNAVQFGPGYPGAECFKTITMKYNGKSATARIMDMCPVCPYGGLDLSRGLFRFFAEEDQGVIYGEWHFGEDDESYGRYSGPPAKTTSKPPTPTHVVVHPQEVFPNPSTIGDHRGPSNRPTNKPEVTRASQPYPWHGTSSGTKERPQVDSKNTSLPSSSLMPTPSQGGSKNTTALNGTALASGTTMPAVSSNATSSPKGSKMEGSDGPHLENLAAALNEILRNFGSITVAASHADDW